MTPASPSSLAVSAQPLDVNEARALTERIKEAAEQVWALLLEAHERRAWETLGYGSWRDYASTEFGMAQSRAYQLLDQARVVRALEEATGSTDVELTEAAARDIKPHLAEVTDEVRERVEAGEEPVEAVRSTVARRRPGPKTAERMAKETGTPVESSDGYIYLSHDDPPPHYLTISHFADACIEKLPPPEEMADLGVYEFAADKTDRAAAVAHDWLSRFIKARSAR